jgi:hypothetical protein
LLPFKRAGRHFRFPAATAIGGGTSAGGKRFWLQGQTREREMSTSIPDDPSISTGTSAASLISAGRVQGTAVYNAKGDHLGHVEDIMLHKTSGKVAYAIMAFGGFLGIGERFHPLPWAVLDYDVDKEGYVVPLDRSTLQAAPSLGRGELGGDDAKWREPVHSYYDTPPYWGV